MSARYYEEPPQGIIHLYDEADGIWTLKDDADMVMDDDETVESHNWEHGQRVNCLHIAADREKKTQVENPKYVQAMKDGKAPMDKLPLRVLTGDAKVHALGAEKYGERNWRKDAIKQSTYEAAIMRHFLAHFADREDRDPESGLSHLYHIRACCAVMIDAEIHGKLIDDRDR